MKHILIGYGYSASYLADQLTKNGELVEGYARKAKSFKHANLELIHRDVVKQGIKPQTVPFYLYYFLSPPHIGAEDVHLREFLQKIDLHLCMGITYISSSAVYGNHQGEEVDESSDCYVKTERQKRRLHAEQQIVSISQTLKIPALILRCAGIYGRKRLPVDAARMQQPVIKTSEAPLTNHIYVVDLARIITYLITNKYSGIYNVSDGQPKPMGFLQQLVAQALDCPQAPESSFQDVYESASEMKRFFMQSSKRIRINKLLSVLPKEFMFTPISEAVHHNLQKQGDY